MRYSLAMLMISAVVGSNDFESAMEAERKPVSAPGIASVNDMDGDNMGDDVNGAGNDDGGKADGSQEDRTGIIGKTAATVVDMKAEMAKNPSLKVVENKTQGGDPVTVAASAYVAATSQIGKLNFENQLKLWKVTNGDKNPSYQEFMTMAKDLNFARLPPYQMYGYNQETGSLVTLEDKADKKKRYEAAGIPFEG
jgi:hypothetical protein